jgi:hypothetical protein
VLRLALALQREDGVVGRASVARRNGLGHLIMIGTRSCEP